MLITAKILANYYVNQNLSRVNLFHNLRYVHLEPQSNILHNIKLKQLIIDKFSSPILKSEMAATWYELQMAHNLKSQCNDISLCQVWYN